MKFIPRNKQLRGVLLGCAALSAVMAGPMILDAGAQAITTATCTAGGVCLTSSQTSPVTTTETTTLSIPFTTTQTNTTTETLTQTTTAPATTVTETTTAPAKTITETQTAPPVTSTVTDTVTTGTTSTVTTTVYPTYSIHGGGFGTPEVREGVAATTTGTVTTTGSESTTSGSACGTPGTTTSLGNGEVETCGPNYGHIAVFATTPGVYNKIFDNTTSYYVSAGIFAPQFRFGFPDGCYYVPDPSSVADPGQTVTTSGTLTNAVAFGLHSHDVSNPIRVPGSDCGGNNP
jgi:hypothetical protein